MKSILADLRYAARLLGKSPGFTAVAVATLGLGIGIGSAIFSVVNAFLLRPLPVRDADQLVMLASQDHHIDVLHYLSYPDYLDYRARTQVFSDFIGYANTVVHLVADQEAEPILVELVTGNYFDMLGVRPVRGRTFLPEEDRAPGADAVLVLSHGYWQRRFGGDPSAIGRAVNLNGHPFTVVGVAPADFPGTEPFLSVSAYLPLTMLGELRSGSWELVQKRENHFLRVMGRLREGESLGRARDEIRRLASDLEREYPETNKGVKVLVLPERRARPDVGAAPFLPPVAGIFLGLAGLVLVITCANVANLLLARAAARTKEIALRAALGASRWRLVRQVLLESALLGSLGGGVGILLAFWTTDFISSLQFPEAPLRVDVTLDVRVLAFGLGVALAAGIVAGLAPALRSSRTDPNEALKEGGRVSPDGNRLGRVLVAAQVSLCLVLLVAASLLMQSLRNARRADPGFRTDQLLLASVDVGLLRYDETRGRRFQRELLDRVRALPAARSAALGALYPFSVRGTRVEEVRVEGQALTAETETVGVPANYVGTDYFRTMGIPLLRGRDFHDRDELGAPQVAVINESMARSFWPNDEAIGKRFRIGRQGDEVEVVGVVRDSSWMFLNAKRPFLYRPLGQAYRPAVTVHVHTEGEPGQLADQVQRIVRELDAEMPVFGTVSMKEHLRGGLALGPLRLGVALGSLFALVGLTLALVGVYGIAAFAAGRRLHEIGIRMALGAEPRDILRLVVRQGVGVAVAGGAVGVVAAGLLARLMRSVLIDVSPTDPLSLAGATLFLAALTGLACYLPARRASRVDPLEVLRYE